ncbi:putative cell surface polysaccharide export ABC-2 transporter ATP-binding protein [Oceaniovalibus guishaninsula JLT2003]|uniref:Putative cell surface polysaccharide export ABC-2 transporter ATP-binding protein n=1 Tax=Oceaniovalibus guishaninsula JLT2003 TaxID=1231392 RepID=K2GPC4_9RHOB|nr:ABC transporter ATP-binding protein [Oceaniovalibus guishaninsula]EKE44526.1 putative cell surface polysaccharide export ABC-2 transporter ATP-binding protein [Oceaniovalibus guishaninsula JLT2003]
MIRFENLSKSFWVRGQRKQVIDGLNLTLPSGKSLALLGRNGVGKTTLLQIIAGILSADSGRIVTDGTISWPVGFSGSTHGQLTGAQNVRFVARVYGVDGDELTDFVEHFAELGNHFYMPISTYSSGMKARLAFGMSMGIRFDTYLIDETTAVGDADFQRKSRAVFMERVKSSSAIMVSHQTRQVRRFCSSGLVMTRGGHIEYFEDIDEAIERHESLLLRGR